MVSTAPSESATRLTSAGLTPGTSSAMRAACASRISRGAETLHSTTSSLPSSRIMARKSSRDMKMKASSAPPVWSSPATVKFRLKLSPRLSAPVMAKGLPANRRSVAATSAPIRTSPAAEGQRPDTSQ